MSAPMVTEAVAPHRGVSRWRGAYTLVSSLFVDPRALARRWRALPYFVRNAIRYRMRAPRGTSFRIRLTDLHYTSFDRFNSAGDAQGHYFHQDLWAARDLARRNVTEHVDVGSRLDGFVAHTLTFCDVVYVDIRPMDVQLQGLSIREGSILAMPFAADSILSLSSLHVIEHIGLGRYGDPVDPEGFRQAAAELVRVLAPGGTLLVGTPVGRERLCFDAHRVFYPETIVSAFAGLRLTRFALIDDRGTGIVEGASFADARRCDYGCGLFVFEKPAA